MLNPAVLSQLEGMGRERIKDAHRSTSRRCPCHSRHHRHDSQGKTSMGCSLVRDPTAVRKRRTETGASIAANAAHWGLSRATVKRYYVAN